MMFLVELIKLYMPAGTLTSLLQEGLTILGWIALWRPGELLFYEWYPFKRDAKISDKLERAEVQVRAEKSERAAKDQQRFSDGHSALKSPYSRLAQS